MIKINLLPPEQKKRIKMLVLYQNVISSGLLLFLMFLLLTVILGGILTFLNFQYLNFERIINDQQSMVIHTETVKTIQNRISDINAEIIDLKKIQDSKSDLYNVLDKITEDLFEGVKINSVEVSTVDKLISVSGFAATRENLVKIRNLIKNNSYYKEVDFPLSNLSNPANINFRFSFKYNQQ